MRIGLPSLVTASQRPLGHGILQTIATLDQRHRARGAGDDLADRCRTGFERPEPFVGAHQAFAQRLAQLAAREGLALEPAQHVGQVGDVLLLAQDLLLEVAGAQALHSDRAKHEGERADHDGEHRAARLSPEQPS